MYLTPREQEKLLVTAAVDLARRRRQRGVKLILDPTPAAYGRLTNAPASSMNVLGRDDVGQPSEATADTLETRLRRTIARVHNLQAGQMREVLRGST